MAQVDERRGPQRGQMSLQSDRLELKLRAFHSLTDENGSLALAGRAAGGLGLVVSAWTAATPALADTAEAAPPAPSDVTGVVVTGVRPLMGDKIPLTQRDTPQSVTVVPQRLIEDQAATRLTDALKNVPGITLNAGEGAARGDTVNLRGFSAFNDFFLDGIRDAAVYSRDTFDLQTVEVLKGPAATLFGRGSTGGAINQVSKAPQLGPLAVVAADAGSNDELRATLDVDQPIGPSAAWRLNAVGEDSGVAGRDETRTRRWGVAPSATFGLGAATTVTLAYLHLTDDDTPDVGVPFVAGAPANVPRGADFGLASDRARSDADIGTLVVRHDFGGGVTLTDTFRAASYDFDYRFHAPNFGSVSAGGQGAPTAATPLAGILVGRDSPSSAGGQTNLTDQLDLTARFSTGPLDHVLVAGFELARQTNELQRFANPFNSNNNWIPETPLLAPNPHMIAPFEPVASTQRTTADSEAAYVTDTIGIGSHLDLIAGVRLDRFAAAYRQLTLASGAVLDLAHVDVVPSPHLAMVYKPAPWQSFYVSYGTSFDPSAEALTLTTKTANLGPVKGTTYEAGSKTSLFEGGLLVTAAMFHTEVDNAQSNDPDNPTLTVLDGDETVRGFELGATGHIGPRFSVDAGYTWLDGTVSGDGSSGAYRGTTAPNLARNALNVFAEYHVTPAWEVGLGANYLGRRFADVYNTAAVPSYVVWNAMLKWKVNERLTLQLNGINLFDKLYYDAFYYTSATENHAVPGPGRTVKLTARASF
jgi:catecholate siderophore receptor